MTALKLTHVITLLLTLLENSNQTRPFNKFKTGLNPKNDEIFRQFISIQIIDDKNHFYKYMRKCNLDCYVSKKCATRECSNCRKSCKINSRSLNSKCLHTKCTVCKNDKSVFSNSCRKCQKKCFKLRFRKSFPRCFKTCKLSCFKKQSNNFNRIICRNCITQKCFFEP